MSVNPKESVQGSNPEETKEQDPNTVDQNPTSEALNSNIPEEELVVPTADDPTSRVRK